MFSDQIDRGCLVIYIYTRRHHDRSTCQSRLKVIWEDVVNADLCKKHLNISLASDRSKWRNVIIPVTADCTPTHYEWDKEMEMKRPLSKQVYKRQKSL